MMCICTLASTEISYNLCSLMKSYYLIKFIIHVATTDDIINTENQMENQVEYISNQMEYIIIK